jgi:hypothetical protein
MLTVNTLHLMDKHSAFLSTDPTSSNFEQNFEMNANRSNLLMRSLDQVMDDLEMESDDENCESNDEKSEDFEDNKIEMHPLALQMTNNTNLVRSFMRNFKNFNNYKVFRNLLN